MKRKVCLLLAAACAVMLVSCGEKERHVYTNEDRNYVSYLDKITPIASFVYPSGMDVNVGLADLVAEIEITSDRVIQNSELDEGIPYSMSRYQARIRDIWYGEAVDTDIVFWIVGEEPELHQNDIIVAYMSYGGVENYYAPVDGEYSVFVVNAPDDTIFSMRLIEEYESFEKKEVSALREETDNILLDIQQTGGKLSKYSDHSIAAPYYEEYLSSVEGDVIE